MNSIWSIIFEDFETGDILRVSKLFPKYRYAPKTQISLTPTKYRYFGDMSDLKSDRKPAVCSSYLQSAECCFEHHSFEISLINLLIIFSILGINFSEPMTKLFPSLFAITIFVSSIGPQNRYVTYFS